MSLSECRRRRIACAWRPWLTGLLAAWATGVPAQVPPGTEPKAVPGFELKRWAREPMLRSPVALSSDDRGRLYVVETARRGSVDIDIRAHPSWLVEDLANQSVDDLRRFFRERMAPERSAENAGWLLDRNEDGSHDWRDLTLVKERVHRLEDATGKGVADRAVVFAEGFHEEVHGVIAGVMPWEDDVFVTVYPDLWRLRDTDGDGKADRQEIVARGFGVHAAFDGHDLHGLTMGPEGKIYFSCGDNGFSLMTREGRRLHHPNTGGVLRMNPDGSELEVFATGLRNVQEIAFDEWGNMFGVDNDGDLADERERFVHIAEGSDSGWRLHWQFREAGWARHTGQPNYNPWIDERMWVPHFPGQPAHITPPLSNYSVGPGSLKYNPGTALNGAYRNHFFLIQFPVAKVTAFQAVPKGAGFEMTHEHVFVSGMMASAVNFTPDGALAIGDWDGMWSPSGKGSIWLVDDPGAARSAARVEVRERLRTGARSRTTDELGSWLGHADVRVRQRAQFELVRRGDFETLRGVVARADAPVLARIHALWGLGQGNAVRTTADLALEDREPHVRAASAKVAGDARLPGATTALTGLLGDPEPRVRFHAAIALGKAGDPDAFKALVAMLAANGDADPFLRHAGVMGLAGAGSSKALAALRGHASAAVRLAAVVALRRKVSDEVAVFLKDPDAAVRREAVRAIHDDGGIPGALPALAAWIERSDVAHDPGTARRVLSANLRLGTESAARRLAAFASDPGHAEELRVEALECLASWARVPALDRVQGMIHEPTPRDPGLGDRMIRERFAAFAAGSGRDWRRALARVALENRIDVPPAVFVDWAMAGDQPTSVRVQALEWLGSRKAERFGEALEKAWSDAAPELRLAALRLEAEHRPGAFLDRINDPTRSASWSMAEEQTALRLLGRIPDERARRRVEERLESLRAGRLAAGLALDVLEAGHARPEASSRALATAIEAERYAAPPFGRHVPSLVGGNAARGREIFRSHPNAQCVRCHDAGGEGNQAGPVLNGVAGRLTREQLLEAILDPSARIADGYATTSVTLRNGDEIDGVRLSETDAELVLRPAQGPVRRLAKREIASQRTSAVSTMPPMGEVLTRMEIRDLVEYLATMR